MTLRVLMMTVAFLAALSLPPTDGQPTADVVEDTMEETVEDWKSRVVSGGPGTAPPVPLGVEDFADDLFAATDAHATFVVDRCDGDIPYGGALLLAAGSNGTMTTQTATSTRAVEGTGTIALTGDAAAMFDLIGGGWCCQCYAAWWGDWCMIYGDGPCCCKWTNEVPWWKDKCYCDTGAC